MAISVVPVVQTEPTEPLLEVADGVAVVTLAKWQEMLMWQHLLGMAHRHEPC
jgi:hypothetical protein